MDLLINIDVDDLAAATDFYRRAFGLRVGRRLGEGVQELLGASSPIYLLHKAAGTAAAGGAGALTTRNYRRHWTPVHIDLVVADVDLAAARALAAGARAEGAVEDFAWGRLARFADPFGHGFCLVQFIGRGYDEIADGQAEG